MVVTMHSIRKEWVVMGRKGVSRAHNETGIEVA